MSFSLSLPFQRNYNLEIFQNVSDHGVVTIGMYVIYVMDWLAVIPRDRFLFFQAEEYFRDRIDVIK